MELNPVAGAGPIGVVGGTGKLGRMVLPLLSDNSVRALARSPEAAEALERLPHVEVAHGDVDDPDTLAPALAGCRRVLVVTPYHPEQARREIAVIHAAQSVGVEHVVKVSSYAAGLTPTPTSALGHRAVEDELRVRGIGSTVLRPDWWLDNLLTQLDDLRQGFFSFPAGDAEVSALDLRDLAEVTARCLTAERPPLGSLLLTGPEALTLQEIADRTSTALGHTVAFRDEVSPSWAPGYAQAMTALFEHYRSRGFSPRTHTVEEATGHAARSVDDFVREVLAARL